MKYKFTLSIGFINKHEEVVEIPDEDLQSLDDEAKEQFLQDWWINWSNNYLDGGWEEYSL